MLRIIFAHVVGSKRNDDDCCCAGTSQTLLFLIEVEEFIKIPEIGFQQNRARKIFFKFIHSKGASAPLTVPITSVSKNE